MRNEENKTFLTCLSHHPGALEQLFCPGGRAFASLFPKNPNSRGSAWGGGGGGMGTAGIDCLKAREIIGIFTKRA